MRKVIAALVVAAVMMVGGPSGDSSAAESIVFNRTRVAEQISDIGVRGPSMGDRSIARYRLSSRSGKTIGQGHEVCVWTSSVTKGCVGVYELPLGSINWSGILRDGGYLAVTGGTLEYRSSLGQLHVVGRTVYISIH